MIKLVHILKHIGSFWHWRRTISLIVLISFSSSIVSPVFAEIATDDCNDQAILPWTKDQCPKSNLNVKSKNNGAEDTFWLNINENSKKVVSKATKLEVYGDESLSGAYRPTDAGLFLRRNFDELFRNIYPIISESNGKKDYERSGRIMLIMLAGHFYALPPQILISNEMGDFFNLFNYPQETIDAIDDYLKHNVALNAPMILATEVAGRGGETLLSIEDKSLEGLYPAISGALKLMAYNFGPEALGETGSISRLANSEFAANTIVCVGLVAKVYLDKEKYGKYFDNLTMSDVREAFVETGHTFLNNLIVFVLFLPNKVSDVISGGTSEQYFNRFYEWLEEGRNGTFVNDSRLVLEYGGKSFVNDLGPTVVEISKMLTLNLFGGTAGVLNADGKASIVASYFAPMTAANAKQSKRDLSALKKNGASTTEILKKKRQDLIKNGIFCLPYMYIFARPTAILPNEQDASMLKKLVVITSMGGKISNELSRVVKLQNEALVDQQENGTIIDNLADYGTPSCQVIGFLIMVLTKKIDPAFFNTHGAIEYIAIQTICLTPEVLRLSTAWESEGMTSLPGEIVESVKESLQNSWDQYLVSVISAIGTGLLVRPSTFTNTLKMRESFVRVVGGVVLVATWWMV